MVDLWLGMGCRYVFSNMERWGKMTEKSYRNGFGKCFDWLGFNEMLVKGHCSGQVIAAFDPCFIKKSGKHTYGLARFWSGTRQKALKGLEIGRLAFYRCGEPNGHGRHSRSNTFAWVAEGIRQVTGPSLCQHP